MTIASRAKEEELAEACKFTHGEIRQIVAKIADTHDRAEVITILSDTFTRLFNISVAEDNEGATADLCFFANQFFAESHNIADAWEAYRLTVGGTEQPEQEVQQGHEGQASSDPLALTEQIISIVSNPLLPYTIKEQLCQGITQLSNRHNICTDEHEGVMRAWLPDTIAKENQEVSEDAQTKRASKAKGRNARPTPTAQRSFNLIEYNSLEVEIREGSGFGVIFTFLDDELDGKPEGAFYIDNKEYDPSQWLSCAVPIKIKKNAKKFDTEININEGDTFNVEFTHSGQPLFIVEIVSGAITKIKTVSLNGTEQAAMNFGRSSSVAKGKQKGGGA